MSQVSEFLARYPVRKGKLGKWQNEIIELRKAGASLLTICRFLAEQGVVAKSGEVHRFLHRCGRQNLIKSHRQKPLATDTTPAPSSDGLPKFEWPPRKNKPSW